MIPSEYIYSVVLACVFKVFDHLIAWLNVLVPLVVRSLLSGLAQVECWLDW